MGYVGRHLLSIPFSLHRYPLRNQIFLHTHTHHFSTAVQRYPRKCPKLYQPVFKLQIHIRLRVQIKDVNFDVSRVWGAGGIYLRGA